MQIENLDTIIRAALEEDMPEGDITSESIISPQSHSEAILLAKEDGVLAGIDVAHRVFVLIDSAVSFEKHIDDGQSFHKHDSLARIKGPSISLLKGERTALNFLQRLSGIASITRKYVEAVSGTKTKILDTRKTTPGLRILEKYAVKMGGGENHRLNLSEMILIKDNHLKIIGSISEAVRKARARVRESVRIEVEATTLEEAREAVESGADMIMLDNMSLDEMKEVMRWMKARVPVEVSGKVHLDRIREIAALGVDYISVGSLTHSFKSVDISMEFLP